MAFDVFLLALLFRECSTLTNIRLVINIIAKICTHYLRMPQNGVT